MICFGFSIKSDVWVYTPKKGFPNFKYPANYQITKKGIALGEKLFFEKSLSIDSSIACSSCHKPEYAFSDNVAFSTGIKNQKLNRNTLPLFNLNWNTSFFWDGRVKTLEEQISHPLKATNEMGSSWHLVLSRLNDDKNYLKLFHEVYEITKIDSAHVVYSISQFLNTRIAANSKYDLVLANKAKFTSDEYEGFEIVNDQSYEVACMHCHTTEGSALTTDRSFSNNGLDTFKNANSYLDKGYFYTSLKASDIGKFRVPSLRNLKFTAPYMHDGRFKTLEEVIDFYSNNVNHSANIDSRIHANAGKEVFTKIEKRKIIAFLNTLNETMRP